MMPGWTHSQCDTCWENRNGGGRKPHRLLIREREKCCFCGKMHESGIYVRADPETTECHGNHIGFG